MSETIAMIEASMRADADALRVIGQNIANAEVTAYRRQIPLNAPLRFERLLESAQIASIGPLGEQRPGTAVDSTPGTLKTTGQPLDLAIEGGGFFVLQASTGPLFTRRGDFHVSGDGLLTAASGEPVLGTNGPISIGTATPTIEPDGTVRVGVDAIDQLQVMHFSDATQLQYIGNGQYFDSGAATSVNDAYSIVRQGFLETSNVAPVGEMVQLMETMRHFEAAQRLVRGYDQMMEKAISELGKIG